jgi:endonuclease I
MKYSKILMVCNLLWLSAITSAIAQQQVIFPGVTGNALIDSLRKHYKPKTVLNYNTARDSMFMSIDYTNGGVFCFYTGDSVTVSKTNARVLAQNRLFNTEHIYPQSKYNGQGNPYSDLHHLRPVRGDVNAARSNYRYQFIPNNQVTHFWKDKIKTPTLPSGNIGEWSKSKEGTTFDNSFFETRDVVKGDVARSMFYFYTMYETEALATDRDFFATQMQTLLAYHRMDPSNLAEVTRTNKIASMQSGKANPFILDSTLVYRAYFTNYKGPELPPIPLGKFKAQYSFSGTASCTDEDVEPNLQNPGLTFGSFFRVGVSCNTVSNAFNSSNWPSAYSATHYVGFKAEALKGYKLSVSNKDTLTLSIRRSSTGPDKFRLALAHGTTLTTVKEGTLSTSGSSVIETVTLPNLSGLDQFEFRLYAWGSTATAGTFRISTLSMSGSVTSTTTGTSIDNDEEPESPNEFRLMPVYPNPFNPTTNLRFDLPKRGEVTLTVTDLNGRVVRSQALGVMNTGEHVVPFNAADLASGVYLARVEFLGQSQTVKMTLLK